MELRWYELVGILWLFSATGCHNWKGVQGLQLRRKLDTLESLKVKHNVQFQSYEVGQSDWGAQYHTMSVANESRVADMKFDQSILYNNGLKNFTILCNIVYIIDIYIVHILHNIVQYVYNIVYIIDIYIVHILHNIVQYVYNIV